MITMIVGRRRCCSFILVCTLTVWSANAYLLYDSCDLRTKRIDCNYEQ